ncbi:TATA box-binding protein-associated factor RNA polymerase I subunit B isoform X2 [Pseudophryne corroboree]|uniref:TATA box-binding protein-associated factor RNA polymerase I subunit B isoform X2 n=1 Tax=Pseudophryne corroboree TaxID=495146 RepID=UPI003081B5E2
MEEEETRHYKEPCPQCSEVTWGVNDEGRFYCKSCHTFIEKTKDVEELDLFIHNSKVQSVSRGLRKAKTETFSWEWYVCEGFQLILLRQAEALQALGVDPQVKDHVMCNLWRRYLHKTKQAYCKIPPSRCWPSQTLSESSLCSSELDSEPDVTQASETEGETEGETLSDYSCGLSSSDQCTTASESSWSVHSGSVDGRLYKRVKKKKRDWKMSMPMTLAFCYLSLLWVRASITLSDLLRLVFYRHVPYFSPEQYLPEKTNVSGLDVTIFEVKTFPVYSDIMELTTGLGTFLELPPFPPITQTCYYHPNVLCMKYLMEVNLPDEFQNWIYLVAKKTGLNDATNLTLDPMKKRGRCIPYDIQAVALIIVVLKLLFALNDDWEWQMSKIARSRNNKKGEDIAVFDFENWYETMRPCMDEARRTREEEYARFSWKNERVVTYSQSGKSKVLKRKRMANNLQRQFSKLSGAAADAGNPGPSSFLFNWEEQNTGKICFHGHSLKGIAQQGKNLLSGLSTNYWLSSLKKCTNSFCKHWKLYEASNFPSSYDFVLSLFSVVLNVEVCAIHYEVCLVEEKLFQWKLKTMT